MYITPRYLNHYVANNYEKFTSSLLKNLIKPNSTFVDIGAHFGYYSLIANQKDAKIFAIEPVPFNRLILRKNFHLNQITEYKLISRPASNKSEEVVFNIANASDSSGISKNPNTKTIQKLKTKTIKCDLFLKNVYNIDFIKIDTEGNEISVIDGLHNTLRNNPHARLIIEFNPKCQIVSNNKPEDLLEKIESIGYDSYLIDDENSQIYKLNKNKYAWTEFMDTNSYRNILCLPKKDSIFTVYFSHSSNLGGAERSLLDLLINNQKNGFLSTVIVPEDKGLLIDYLERYSIPYFVIPYSWWASIYKLDNTFIRKSTNCICENIRYFEKLNPDNAFTNTSVIPWGVTVSNILKIKHIWKVNEFIDKDHRLKPFTSMEDISSFIHENSNSLIYNSNSVKDYFEKLYKPVKGQTLYYSFNEKLLTNLSKNKVRNPYRYKNSTKIICVGGISQGKNQLLAIKACLSLINKNFDIELLLLGRYSSTDKYYQTLKKVSKNSDRIIFHHEVENAYPYFRLSDISVVCSNNEAFGRVTVESILLGKPVIGTNSGGTPEIIGKHPELLFELNNQKQLEEKILFLINNNKILKDLALICKREVKLKFDNLKYYKNIQHILKHNKTNLLIKYKHELECTKNNVSLEESNNEIIKYQYNKDENNYYIKEIDKLKEEISIIKDSKLYKLWPIYNTLKKLFRI